MKRVLFFCVGLLGWLTLLCSVAAVQVTSSAQMEEGFLRFAQTSHLGVPASRYGAYAAAISAYLDGKSDLPRVAASDHAGGAEAAFSDKENAHLKDVRGIVTALKAVRLASGAGVILLLALFLARPNERESLLRGLLRGLAASAIGLLTAGAALGVWGAVNFQGLFWTFHRVAFTNDLWLLNPQTDLLVALMPLPFFSWYAGRMLISLLPILGVMLLIIIARFKAKGRS